MMLLKKQYQKNKKKVSGRSAVQYIEKPAGGRNPRAVLSVFFAAAGLWFLMNIRFQPRHTPAFFTPGPWISASLAANCVFALALALARKWRSLAVIPLFFAAFPASFTLMAKYGGILTSLAPSGGIAAAVAGAAAAAAGGLHAKFVYDIIWITAELFFCIPLFMTGGCGNPFYAPAQKTRRQKPPGKEKEGRGRQNGQNETRKTVNAAIRAVNVIFIAGCALLLFIWLVSRRFPAGRFAALLCYHIPFSVLMGLKEELYFRWGLAMILKNYTGSAFTSAAAAALVWGLYHGFFGGENIGAGFGSFLLCALVSLWWSFLTFRNGNILSAAFQHSMIEWYGFYFMYGKYL